MRDTLDKPMTEPYEDGPARFRPRRVVRWIAVLTFGIVLVLALWQEPLHALRAV